MDTAASATATTAPGPASEVVVDLDGAQRAFGSGAQRVLAVDGVDLSIHRGEVVALLGPNGAGKTTTLDMLLGLTEPSAGTVNVLGGSPGGLLADLTVGETVRLIASLYGPAALARVPEVMERAGLAHLARRRVSKCSGGEQQRVRFALALTADPEILVLDEPTAGMDVTARRNFWNVMRAEADAGRTIIFATHYLEEAEQFARRTVVMHHGRVVADAPTAELRAGLGARTVAATLLDATADETVAALRAYEGVSDLRIDAGRLTLRSADSDAVAGILLAAGARNLEIAAPTLETAFTALTED